MNKDKLWKASRKLGELLLKIILKYYKKVSLEAKYQEMRGSSIFLHSTV